MPTFLKQWLILSVSLTAFIYILIVLFFGHDPAPVTHQLILGAYWANTEAVLAPLEAPYPKFIELFFGPAVALWYQLFYTDKVWWSQRFVTLVAVWALSHVVMSQSFWLGLLSLGTIGYLIGKERSGTGMVYINILCFGSFLIMWVLAPYSLGLVPWSLMTITTLVGYAAGCARRRYVRSRR